MSKSLSINSENVLTGNSSVAVSNSDALGEYSGKDEKEIELESAVFGHDGGIFSDDGKEQHSERYRKKRVRYKKDPAWKDEDDSNVTVNVAPKEKRLKYFNVPQEKSLVGEAYQNSLKSKFEKISGEATWAKLKWEKEDDNAVESDPEASELLQSTGNYLDSSKWLAKNLIQLNRCTDINKDSRSKGKLRSVEFHTRAQVVLCAGMDQRLNLFQVDGKENPKIQSVFLDKFPIHTAHFTADGNEVIMGSRHKNFYCYDMIAGKVVNVQHIKGLEETNMKQFVMSPDGKFIVFLGSHGKMHFISTKSKEWIDSAKMNGTVEALTFDKDGSHMYSFGDDGDVYVWDMSRRSCIHKFRDDGCIQGTSIAVSNNGQYLATGAYSGVVNVYEKSSCLTNTSPKPLKAVMNLTTPCTNMVFNHSNEILSLSSNYTERAVKLVHLPSLTVFSNFPEMYDPLRIAYSMDISPNSGYLSLGNHKGEALLYRVKHYSNY